jgi:hypothetical protein
MSRFPFQSSQLTLVEVVLILLALLAPAGGRVDLVSQPTEEVPAATARAALLPTSRALVLILLVLVASREAIEGTFELVHGGERGGPEKWGATLKVIRELLKIEVVGERKKIKTGKKGTYSRGPQGGHAAVRISHHQSLDGGEL